MPVVLAALAGSLPELLVRPEVPEVSLRNALLLSSFIIFVAAKTHRVIPSAEARDPVKPAGMTGERAGLAVLAESCTRLALLVFVLAAAYLVKIEPLLGVGSALRDRSHLAYLEKLRALSSEQFAAIVLLGGSTLALLTLTGVSLTSSSAQTSTHVRFLTTSLAGQTVYVMFVALRSGHERFRRDFETMPPQGLAMGLLCAGLGQVVVIAYYYARLRLGWCRRGYPLIQKPRGRAEAETTSREFWARVFRHLAQPSAFALLAAYLSGTWLLGMMPTSYYDLGSGISLTDVSLQLIVVDGFTYLNHRVEHALSSLYASSHKPHHRFTSPRLLDAFDGSLLDTTVLILLPLFCTMRVCRFVSCASYAAFGVAYSAHFMLIHSEWTNPTDDWCDLIYTAKHHHGHHARFKYNFAHFFTIWDRLGGTFAEWTPVESEEDGINE